MKDKTTRRRFLKTVGGAAVTVVVFEVPSADAASKPQTFAFAVDARKCIGCGKCVRACSEENDVPDQFFRTWIERYTTTVHGEVLVESPEGGKDGFGSLPVADEDVAKSFFVPKLCNHCKKPPCVQVCPVGATFRVSDGAILVDQKRCIGCGYCVQSCPYSARFINPATHTADKCTWCYHRITKKHPPACVGVCPVGARRFGVVEDGSEMQKLILSERVNVLKGDLGTDPAVYYQGLSMEVR